MNNTTNIFEIASRSKFRYPYKGMITTEDLWDLDIDQLNIVYRNLNNELKTIDGDNLIASESANENVKANDLKNKIEVVKYIFNHKQKVAEDARMAVEKSAKKQRILDILARRQENALENMSEDDLKKMLDNLG